MALAISQLFTPATQPQWLSTLLTNATNLGLTTTSWQSGAPERTILAILSYALNFADATTSAIAQGGFLDFSGSGTVTYTIPNPDGTSSTVTAPVTPDPSIPAQNPNGTPGWLDALADSSYNVQRITATFAGGAEAITNISANTYGPYAAGTYHVADPNNKATYSNAVALTIAPSVSVATVSNVSSSSGLIKVTTSAAHGLSTGAAVTLIGVGGTTPLTTPNAATSWYITAVDATNFTLNGSTFSGAFTSGGTVYTPTVATFTADVAGSKSNSTDSTGALALHTVTQPVTSLVGVTVDNLATFTGSDTESNAALVARCRLKLQSLSNAGTQGAYKWAALSSQQLAPGLPTPQTVSAAITRASVFKDKTTGSVTTWIANAAGTPNATDISATDAVIQAYVVPLGVTATTLGASTVNVTVVADVWVPAALNTTATKTLFQTAIASYFATLPIGGVTDSAQTPAYTNVVPFDAVLGTIFSAGSLGGVAVQQATLTLNGATLNISLTFTGASAQVAVLSPSPVTINLHSV